MSNAPQGPEADAIRGTIDGRPITDAEIERLAADAERGFAGKTLRPVGRPREVGAEASRTVTLRLDPQRLAAVKARAAADRTTASSVLRQALDDYLAS